MTRITSFYGQPIAGASGNAAGRTRGSAHGKRHGRNRRSARQSSQRAARQISGLVSFRQSTPPPLSRAAGVQTLATVGLVAVAVTAAAVLWRGASKRIGAGGIGPAGLHLRSTSTRPPEVDEPVSVLIAVRHEPDPTVAAVRAALDQRGVGHLDIVVLDDGCPQETRTALRQEFGDDPRVRILAAAPLPRGWSPRAHRSHQLAVAARGRVLIFTEPSTPLGPHAAASVTALLRGEHLDLAVLDTGKPTSAVPREAAAATSSANGGARQATSSTHGSAHDDEPRGDRSTDAQTNDPPSNSAQRSREVRPGDGDRPANGGPPHSDRPHGAWSHGGWSHSAWSHGVWPHGVWPHSPRPHGSRIHPGRFTVAVDADAYWRTGGYRAAADDPDPLALLRMLRRASGRVAVADGRSVIPPAQLIAPLPPADPQAEAEWDSLHSSRLSLSETARRVLAALVLGARS